MHTTFVGLRAVASDVSQTPCAADGLRREVLFVFVGADVRDQALIEITKIAVLGGAFDAAIA